MAKAQKPATREKKRATFVVYTDTKDKIDYMAFKSKKDISDIVETALTEAIAKFEKKNGPIPA